MIVEIVAVILLIGGSLLMLFASIGLLRMPDIYMRMHATTKSSSLGILFMLIAISLIFPAPGVWLKAMATLIFIFLTVPIASHLIGRVAHNMQIPKWDGTVKDDLEDDESNLPKGDGVEIKDGR